MDRNLRIRMLFDATDKVTGPLKAIVGGSRAASAALKDTRDKLKGVEAAQADIREFRSLKAGLTELEGKGQAAQARVAALARQIDAAGAPTKKLTADFNRAKREAAQLGDEHRRESERLQLLRSRLGGAGIATAQLVSHERRLRTEAAGLNRELSEQEKRLRTVDDRASRLARARAGFSKMQGVSTGLAAGGVASIGTGLAITAPLKGATDAAAEFESTLVDIAQKQAMTVRQAAALRQQLLLVSKETGQLPSTLAAGADALVGMGMAPSEAAKLLGPISKAATAYKADMNDLARAGFAATDNLKISAADGSALLGILATAGKEGAVELKDMAQYLPSLTAGYQALGQKGLRSAADLAAGLEVVKTGTGDAASAATNLENLLQKLSSPATNRAFAKMGVDLPAALKKAYAQGKMPIEAISELTNKTLKGDLSRLGYLFEDAQVQGALRPLIQNIEKFREIREKAMAGKNAVDVDFAGRQAVDPAQKEIQLAAARERLALVTGSLLIPTMIALYDKGTAIANAIGAWAAEHPTLSKYLMIGAAAAGGLLIILGGLSIAVAGIIAPFAALAAVAGFVGLSIGAVVGIALSAVTGIAMLAGAAFLIHKYWDKLPAMFSSIGSAIMDGLVGGISQRLSAVKSMILGIGGKVAGWFKGVLGIHSPSRVFRAFGGNIMDGLAIGLDDRRGEPVRRINSAAGQLTSALAIGMATPAIASTPASAMPARPTAAAPAPAITNSYHFTISGVRDDGDLEARLRTIMERIDRERDARTWSAFSDRADGEDA